MLRGNWPYLGNNRERRTKEQASAIKDVQKKKKRRNMYRNKVVIAFTPPVFKVSKYIYYLIATTSCSLFSLTFSRVHFSYCSFVGQRFCLFLLYSQFTSNSFFRFCFFNLCASYISNE